MQLTDGDGQAILPSRWPPGKTAAPKRAPGRFLVATPRGVALVKGAFGLDGDLVDERWKRGDQEAIERDKMKGSFLHLSGIFNDFYLLNPSRQDIMKEYSW